MQTIDLGNISIGSEDLEGTRWPGAEAAPAPQMPSSPMPEAYVPPCAESPEPSRPTVPCQPSEPSESGRPSEPCQPCGDHRPQPGGDDIYFEKCEDHKLCHLGDTVLDGQGRILDLTLTLKNVCPGKRVAVGVALNEVDGRGNEYPRGMKTFTVPAHRNCHCMDIPVASMRFILPEDISVSGRHTPGGSRRHFTAKVIAHYIDFNSANAAL